MHTVGRAKITPVEGGITAPQGFRASGVACGIKANGRPDLAIVTTADRRAVPAGAPRTTAPAAPPGVLAAAPHWRGSSTSRFA